MSMIVKWLCHVFIMSLFSQCFPMQKKRSELCSLPENAQDSTIHYLYSHLKTTVKLHSAVVRGVGREIFDQHPVVCCKPLTRYERWKRTLSHTTTYLLSSTILYIPVLWNVWIHSGSSNIWLHPPTSLSHCEAVIDNMVQNWSPNFIRNQPVYLASSPSSPVLSPSPSSLHPHPSSMMLTFHFCVTVQQFCM